MGGARRMPANFSTGKGGSRLREDSSRGEGLPGYLSDPQSPHTSPGHVLMNHFYGYTIGPVIRRGRNILHAG